MKIVSISATNVKRLKAIEITAPDENVIIIAGKNGAGKSSVLDTMQYGISGASERPGKPIRDGETTAEVVLDLGDLRVQRVWTTSGTYLHVTAPDGAEYRSPQKIMDSLHGKVALDPSRLINMSDEKRNTILANIAGIDITSIDAEYNKAYEDRKETGKYLRSCRARTDALSAPEDDLPETTTSVVELSEQLQDATARHNEHTRNVEQMEAEASRVQPLRGEASRIEVEIQALTEQIERKRERLETISDDIKNIILHVREQRRILNDVVLPNIEDIRQQIVSVESVNRMVTEATVYRQSMHELQEVLEEYNRRDTAVHEVIQRRRDIMANASYPIEGLSLSEDGKSALFRGIPWEQLSSSDKLRISLGLAMEMDPHLRVILMREGSLFDDENMRIIREMAKEKDFQVWVERVDDSGEIGIIIEDGEVLRNMYAQSNEDNNDESSEANDQGS